MQRRESRSDALKGVKAKIEAWKREAEADKQAALDAVNRVKDKLIMR